MDNLSQYLVYFRDYIHPKGVAKVLARHQKSWPYVWAHVEHFRDDYLIESDGNTFTALEWEKQRKAGLISYERAQHGGLTMLGKWVEMGSLIVTFRNEWFLTFSLHLFDENRTLAAHIAQHDQGSEYRCYTE